MVVIYREHVQFCLNVKSKIHFARRVGTHMVAMLMLI